MSNTQYAWGSEFESHDDYLFPDVNLITEEYEFLIDKVHSAIKEQYKDDETCRFYSKLLGKLLILANQWNKPNKHKVTNRLWMFMILVYTQRC